MTDYFDNVRICQRIAVPNGTFLAFQDRQRFVEIGAIKGEGDVGRFTIFRRALDDHIHVNGSIGKWAKYAGGNARSIGNVEQGDLRLIARIGDTTDDFLLQDLVLVYDERSGRIIEARSDLQPNAARHGQFDRTSLQYFGALRRHLEHLFVGNLIKLAGLSNDPRIGRVNAINVGKDIAAIGAQSRGQRNRG